MLYRLNVLTFKLGNHR